MQGAAPVHLPATLGQQLLRLDFVALKVPLLLHRLRVQGCQGSRPAQMGQPLLK